MALCPPDCGSPIFSCPSCLLPPHTLQAPQLSPRPGDQVGPRDLIWDEMCHLRKLEATSLLFHLAPLPRESLLHATYSFPSAKGPRLTGRKCPWAAAGRGPGLQRGPAQPGSLLPGLSHVHGPASPSHDELDKPSRQYVTVSESTCKGGRMMSAPAGGGVPGPGRPACSPLTGDSPHCEVVLPLAELPRGQASVSCRASPEILIHFELEPECDYTRLSLLETKTTLPSPLTSPEGTSPSCTAGSFSKQLPVLGCLHHDP